MGLFMRKRTKVLFLSIVVIIIIITLLINAFWPNILIYFMFLGAPYNTSQLNYLEVPFENESDIITVNGGFSTTNSCPWARAHLGFDFEFRNNSNIIAAAPGKVVFMDIFQMSSEIGGYYVMHIFIQFNATVIVNYGFEPWTTDRSDAERQFNMFSVKVGDWVNQSQKIGTFLRIGESAHIHFDVLENNNRERLDKYFSAAAHQKMMNLVHKFHPEWPHYCFDDETPLNYAIKPFDSPNAVKNFSKTWSLTSTNPWGSPSPGLNFQLIQGYTIRTMTPGRVIELKLYERIPYNISKYYINLTIAYNSSIEVTYLFETGSDSLSVAEYQLASLSIKKDQWLPLNWTIGFYCLNATMSFLQVSIIELGQFYRIDRYFSDVAKQQLLEILHIYHPGWSLIYL